MNALASTPLLRTHVSFHGNLYPFYQSLSFLGHRISTFSSVSTKSSYLFSIGSNVNGALGTGNVKYASSPQNIDIISNPKQISCGWGHSAAVTEDGRAFLWGRTHDVQQAIRFGRLENNSPSMLKIFEYFGSTYSIDSLFPMDIGLPEGEHAIKASCGGGLTTFLCESGKVYCIGSNLYGQCGIGTRDMFHYDPLQEVKGFQKGEKVIQVEAGFRHVVALADSGSVYTWGKGHRGQVGQGPAKDMLVATNVTSGDLNSVIEVRAGFNYCLALQANGEVKTWGKFQRRHSDDSGWVNFIDAWIPIAVPFPSEAGRIKRIWSGINHNVALTENNLFYQWGRLADNSVVKSADVKAQVSAKTTSTSRKIRELAQSTVYNPVLVNLRRSVSKHLPNDFQIHTGYNNTVLTSPSTLDAPLIWDWSLEPIPWPLEEPELADFCDEFKISMVAHGWKHKLLLAKPK